MKYSQFRNLISDSNIHKFLLVGISSSAIVLVLTAVFTTLLGIFYALSAIIALEISLFSAFFAHDRWTFSKNPKGQSTIRRFLSFNLFSLMGFGINEVILISLTSKLGIPYLYGEGTAIVMTFFFNFIMNSKITWKK